MSTEDQNRCVVTVNKGVDVDALMEEITSLGGTTPHIPQRTVEMWNEKQDSLYNFDVVLTRAEAETLKQDPRIIDVRYGSKEENGIFLRRNVLDTSRNYSRSTSQNNSHYAWAIPSCMNTVNPFTSLNLSYQHAYTAIGENVDVIIQDSGIQVGHPEWLAQDGVTSRLQQINWPTESGLSGTYTQGPSHYTDTYGHGTHCAGTSAGRRFGWARAANIYAIKIFDTDAFGTSASFNMMRAWHNLKTNTNPTIVNMSWGYFQTYQNIVGGNYRGTAWTATTAQSAYGMIESVYNFDSNSGTYSHPIRLSSVDADISACIDAGMILVAAAGNDTHKQDISTGLDYNNYYTTSGASTRYYHRGSTPNGPTGVISVGAIRAALTENKSAFSTCGPGITVYAPGEAVQSAMPISATLGSGAVTHPDNASFYIKKIQGTSMAAPQVTGVLACLLGSRRHYNAADCIQWLSTTGSTANRITDTGGSYTDQTSLQGSPNRYLKWPFTGNQPLTITAS
jgi:subtilisin family serine protease